jgi:hypothetical protein
VLIDSDPIRVDLLTHDGRNAEVVWDDSQPRESSLASKAGSTLSHMRDESHKVQ